MRMKSEEPKESPKTPMQPKPFGKCDNAERLDDIYGR